MRVSDIITQLNSEIMKKLFIALMAVCVMASCGGDKKNGGNNASDNTGNNTEQNDVKTQGDVLMVMADVMNSASAELDRVTSGDELVTAMVKFAANAKEVETKYAYIINPDEEITEEEAMKKYPEAFEALVSAQEKFFNSMMVAAEKYELTPEQEERIQAAMGNM